MVNKMVNETKTWGKKPNMKEETLKELARLLEQVYPNKWRYCIDVMPVAVMKTIDNEEDAQETIRKLKKSLNKNGTNINRR